jgi:two-component system, sensor histidine kinase and response regulator
MRANLHVLLAGDHANGDDLAGLLRREGHTVTVVEDGDHASRIAKEADFDFILMDLEMPGLTGAETTARIRRWEQKIGGHVPIIAVTAGELARDHERCLTAGMDGCLSSPVRAAELFSIMAGLFPANDRPDGASPRASDDDGTFDEERLLQTVEGDRELMGELTGLFLDDAPTHIAAIRAAVAANNAPDLRAAAHALKGAAATLAAGRVSAAAQELELLGASDAAAAGAAALLELDNAFARLRDRLGGLIATP